MQIFRHIAANLSNGRFSKNIPLRKHLEPKGQVVGLVKGASYLLWQDRYSLIRDHVLAYMPFIVSDSSGVPVVYALASGYQIQTFREFRGSFLRANDRHNESLRALWQSIPISKCLLGMVTLIVRGSCT